jgi:hypothetical protein
MRKNSRTNRIVRLVALRIALAAIALLVLGLFQSLQGQLPWLGHFEWIEGIRPESGLAWTAPLSSPALDEDGRRLDTALLEWRPGAVTDPGAWLCRLAGPGLAQTPDAFCARRPWRMLGPAHQLHDDIRRKGGGGFSVWHGTLYFSLTDGVDPNEGGRRFALWIPWTEAAAWAACGAAAALLWAVWPLACAVVRQRPRLTLAGLGLLSGAAAARHGAPFGTLAWAGLLLACTQLLPQIRHVRYRSGWVRASALTLAGFLVAEAGLSLVLPDIGLVPDLQSTEMLKYLVDLDTDRPILLLVGSSYSQYGLDETALEAALGAGGHPMQVVRLGFGGMSIPERLYYVRRYLATARHRPAAVLFEVAAYYDLQPLVQLDQNPFSRREIAAMDRDNLRLSLEWVLGPEGAGSNRLALTAELLGDFALRTLHAGFLPGSTWRTVLLGKDYRGTPPKTAHYPDAVIAADLAAGQNGRTLSGAVPVPGAIPTRWTRQAIAEEIALFSAAGTGRFGFYAPPSRYADEPIYARQFCQAMTAYPCIPADDPDLIAGLGHDEDWLDQTHLQGPGRQLYTAWLATRLAASGVLP